MREASAEADYNPSSLHAEGRRAAALLDAARDRVAALLGVTRGEITFTSSGTEADNLAILGVARATPRGAHVVTTAVEHHAVTAAIDRLRDEGYVVTELPVGPDGRVSPREFAGALRPSTVLASVMYANNEVGTIQPIAVLAAIARERGVAFHTDAVQAPSWLPIGARELGVDLLSISAHKFGGPKGVGLLYARRGIPMQPIVHGGGQEFGRRSGTPNVAGIVGMARALELAVHERPEANRRVARLRDRLEAGIGAAVSDVRVNGGASRLPNSCNVSFAGVESVQLLIALDLAGVAVSAGSACASGSLEPSHVLAALGLERRWQTGAVRFTLGTKTTAAEIERVLALVPAVVDGLRHTAGAPRGDG